MEVVNASVAQFQYLINFNEWGHHGEQESYVHIQVQEEK